MNTLVQMLRILLRRSELISLDLLAELTLFANYTRAREGLRAPTDKFSFLVLSASPAVKVPRPLHHREATRWNAHF